MNNDRIDQIRSNYQKIQQLTWETLKKGNRSVDEVKIIVVSKKHDVETIQAAIQAGVRIFGENYADEASEKIQTIGLGVDLEWHMIGHVQSRKVKIVCLNFTWLHSLDSVHLAQKFEEQLTLGNQRLNVLLEFNIAGEATKSGWNASDENGWKKLLPEIETILQYEHLCIEGIMVMPPLAVDPESTRPYFQMARKLLNFLQDHVQSFSGKHLSMGTSSDYAVAIEEGATMIRVGEAILGPRKYN